MATRLPPQNLEAEESVLGALMIDKDAIIKVADRLAPADFYKAHHGQIYEAILKLFERHEPIDILSVTSKLKELGALKDIGGSTYLTQLIEGVPTSSHVEHYTQIVKEKKILRDLINTSAEITETAFSPGDDVETVLDTIEQKIFAISQKSTAYRFIPIREELKSAYERIEKLHQGEGRLRGVGTGFTALDNYLSGLQKSDLIVLGARPSLGKTSFALDVARHAAIVENRSVGIFSLEMSREQVIDRFIAAESRVPLWRLRTGRLSDDTEFELIQAGLDVLSRAPIFIDDAPTPNILQMRSMARRLQAEHGLDLIIADYLQLIQPRTATENLVQQVTEISRGLKALARELSIPVLAISQLSRSIDHRETKIPRLSDLRESGCLAGKSQIMRADTGELVTIRELAEGRVRTPIPVFTLDNNWQLTIKPLTKAFANGIKKVYELKTQSGRTIKASANHPFRRLENWSRLDELKPEDRIALPRSLLPIISDSQLADDELILLAHLIGDGCILPNRPFHYTSADWGNIQTVKESAKKLFSINGRIVRQQNWWHVYLPSPYHLTHNRPHPITKWLRKLGTDLYHSYRKIIPPPVFECSGTKIALFLRHLWSTDGNISWKKLKGRLPTGAIYYSTASETLAEQVQHLLLRFAIQSRLSRISQGNYRPSFQVHIQGTQNQQMFLKTVGCAGKRGEIIPQLLEALKKIVPNPNNDIIPLEAWQLAVTPAKATVGLSWRGVAAGIENSYSGSSLFKSGIGRERMARLAKVCTNRELTFLSTSDVYWDKIVSITPLGKEEVYDATVEDTHNFIANDIIVHNSIEQDSDVVLFIYRKDRDKINPTPEEQNTAEIIIAKHRNGPLGTVQLKFDPEQVSFRNIDKVH